MVGSPRQCLPPQRNAAWRNPWALAEQCGGARAGRIGGPAGIRRRRRSGQSGRAPSYPGSRGSLWVRRRVRLTGVQYRQCARYRLGRPFKRCRNEGGSPGHACCRFLCIPIPIGVSSERTIGGGGGRRVVEARRRGGCRTWRGPLCFPGILAVADCRGFSRFRCGDVVAAGGGSLQRAWTTHRSRRRMPIERKVGSRVKKSIRVRTDAQTAGCISVAEEGRIDFVSNTDF